MSEIKSVFLCAAGTARKRFFSYKTFVVFAVILIFHWYAYGGMPKVCEYLQLAVSPWVFPFFIAAPTMFFVVGGMALLLHCDAPYMDAQMSFMIIRTGRRAWIRAQILYVCLSSLVYAVFHVLASWFVMLPHVKYSDGWGSVLKGLANDPGIFGQAGVRVGFQPYSELMKAFTPLEAMGWSILLLWLGTVFLGMVILFMRVLTGKTSGIAVGGFLAAFAYFSAFQGQMAMGGNGYYFSPVNWMSPIYIDWNRTGNFPPPAYVLTVYIVLIVSMMLVSVDLFCRKDMVWEED